MYLQKVISKKTCLFFVDVLKVNDENSRIRIRIPISQRYGSADPDPYRNFMDLAKEYSICDLVCSEVGVEV